MTVYQVIEMLKILSDTDKEKECWVELETNDGNCIDHGRICSINLRDNTVNLEAK